MAEKEAQSLDEFVETVQTSQENILVARSLVSLH
jgi:hypothetical protein